MEMDSRSEGAGKGCLEELMRERIRATIEAIVDEELEAARVRIGKKRVRVPVLVTLGVCANGQLTDPIGPRQDTK